ncbi:MAG: methionyl-tRNA formyltransferase [Planctomycetota bacterium]|jgi:methionyl-tRNA formyltransferase
MMKLGVLVSGKLGDIVLKRIYNLYDVKVVFTDFKSQSVIDFCISNNLPLFKGNPRNKKGYNFIKNIKVDVIASINYLFLIEKDIINLAIKGVFNIHGSLLPKYRGRTPHVWAIINNEKFTGITAHLIEEGCDTGDILEQIKITIDENDTGGDLLLKFQNEYESLTLKVLANFSNNTLKMTKQDEFCATYYGKRTSDDGRINWNWQKERIRNWVRAQSYPYPGAFSFFNNNKIIIDEIKFSSHGFNFKDENGLILKVNPSIIIKTVNGAIELKKIRNNIELSVGDKLN